MPLVEISLLAGRPPGQVRDLIHRVHAAVEGALDVPPANIRVIIREVPLEHWAVGDVTKAEQR
ncbi:MAG: 4-oxalocrotonate tautomerase [Mycobacteriales bacterium]|jgi:4-oxalocrotonate tautomerase